MYKTKFEKKNSKRFWQMRQKIWWSNCFAHGPNWNVGLYKKWIYEHMNQVKQWACSSSLSIKQECFNEKLLILNEPLQFQLCCGFEYFNTKWQTASMASTFPLIILWLYNKRQKFFVAFWSTTHDSNVVNFFELWNDDTNIL